jgi:integrase
MVFKAKGRSAWKARVRHPDGRSKVCGCDTTNRATAKQMERWAHQLYADRTPTALATLDAIITGRATLPRAFDSRHDLKALVRDMDDVDLEPFVVRWQKELARKGTANPETRAKYLKQVRRLMPAGEPFLRSRFTKQAIRDWLEALGIGQTNRYRAALSSFAQFLAFEDVLTGNPVRLVSMSKENEPRLKYLVQLDAKKLVAQFTDERLKAVHCAMLASGMEISAARAIDPSQCTESSVFAAGTKGGGARARTCRIYPRWQWAWKIALAYIEQAPDGAKPFAGIVSQHSNAALRRALKAAGLDETYTQHDHRHTWAVQARRDGLDMHVIASQLGHANDTMARRVYGRFTPDDTDFVTPQVTRIETPHEV